MATTEGTMAMGTEQQPKRELYVRRLKFDSLILLFYIGVGSHYIITYFFLITEIYT